MSRKKHRKQKAHHHHHHTGTTMTTALATATPAEFYSHGTDLYRAIDRGPWRGLQKIAPQKIERPCNRWTGAKITIEQWQQVSAFLHWSQRETGAEAMAHILYATADDDGPECWQPVVLPQQGYTGMSVKLLSDPDLERATFARLPARNWRRIVTAHHHCRIGASQSSGDRADEISKDGLHITLGNMDEQVHSIHLRTSFNGSMFEPVLSDWLSLDEQRAALIPAALHDQLLRHLLTQAQPDKEFPAWWKENLRKPAPVTTTTYAWQGHGTGYFAHGGYFQQGAKDRYKNRAKNKLETWLRMWHQDLDTAEQMLFAIDDDAYSALVDIIVDCETDVKTMEDIVSELRDEHDRASAISADFTPDEIAQINQAHGID